MSGAGLQVGVTVPEAALLSGAVARIAALSAELGGSWFDAASHGDDPAVWPDRCAAQRQADAVSPEPEGQFQTVGDRAALLLRAGRNCAYRVRDVVRADSWTVACIWHPAPRDEDTRSLFALRGSGRSNYVYLSQDQELTTTLRDNAGAAIAALPGAGDGWQAVMASQSGGELRLWRPADDAFATAAGAGDFAPKSDLLIGARSHRQGMPKTLGSAAIGGVLLWPGLDVLSAPPGSTGHRLRDAFASFCLWEL
ncbi:hypothetical protein SAMN05421538_101571 [Paracoccus isoporae]|uniref:Uncharacterized protein n=1 Tax=Paracoccus isoporae TaxID=591205 RepID=A0A1G6UM81_9RHOB|nr:hypothetical protein [Paracoccus isoporae]SDD41816.1 hypothetical protein SAMN05421538_101571 [Paracoccus isoporae]